MEIFAKLIEIAAIGDADAVALFLQRGQGAAPNHIVDGDLYAEEDFLARLKVDDADQIGVIEAEEIGEVAVLTVDVGVVRVIEGRFVVGGEEGNALRNHFLQCGATATVNVFCKHIDLIYC